MTNDVIEFKSIYKGRELGRNIVELLNLSFIITSVSFTEGNYGKIAVITTDNGSKYYTSSKVLLKQLEEIKKYTDRGQKVKVTLRKVKRYYTFE